MYKVGTNNVVQMNKIYQWTSYNKGIEKESSYRLVGIKGSTLEPSSFGIGDGKPYEGQACRVRWSWVIINLKISVRQIICGWSKSKNSRNLQGRGKLQYYLWGFLQQSIDIPRKNYS